MTLEESNLLVPVEDPVVDNLDVLPVEEDRYCCWKYDERIDV